MSDINVNFTVNTVSTEFTVDQFSNIVLTVDEVFEANFSVEGVYNPNGGAVGGSNTQLQYNNQGVLAGANTVTYANGNITLGDVSNVRILGGNANARLTTDGNGNLSWQVLDSNSIGGNVSNVRVNADGNITVSSNLQPNIITVSSNGTFANTRIANDVTITGNLNVGGNITYTGVTNLAVENPLIDVGGGPNNTPLTSADPYDRGLVLHTYNDGISFTLTASANSGANTFTSNTIVGVQVGNIIWARYSNGAQVFSNNSVVSSVDDANSTITISGAAVSDVPEFTVLYQGEDRLAFVGLDQANAEFAVATSVEVIDNQITYTQLGNLRGDTWLGNVVGNNITSTQAITANAIIANIVAANNANISNTVTANSVTSATVSATGNINSPSVVAGTITGSGNVVFTGNTISLGSNSAVKITGGNAGQILSTDGSGDLSWIDQNSINPVPYMNWLVNATANNQQFVNESLNNYYISNDLALFRNGVYVDPVDYTITGNTLTVNVLLYDQDTLDIIRQGSTSGGNGGGSDYSNANVSRYLAVYNGNLQANNFTGSNITASESLIASNGFSVTGAASFGGNITAGNITGANVNFNAATLNAVTVANLTVNNLANLGSNANIRILGGSNTQVLTTDGNGNLRWANGVAGAAGSNQQIQFNLNGNLTGANGLLYDADLNRLSTGNGITAQGNSFFIGAITVEANAAINGTLTAAGNALFTGPDVNLGNVGNLQIQGGTTGQFLQTDGTGNLSWATVTAGVAYSNANVANYLPTYTGNMTFGNANIRVTGGSNLQYLQTDGLGNLSWSNGYTNTNVANYLPAYTGNMTFGNANLKINGGSNLQYLQTDGAGNLSWSNGYGNGNVANYLPTYTGNMTFGNANLKINGGSNNQVLRTDGTGNLSWTTVSVSMISNGNSNVSIPQSGGNVIVSVAGQANVIQVSSTGLVANTVIQNDLTVTGNLSVQGTTIYANTETLLVEDPIISIGTGSNGAVLTSQDNKDRGLALHTYGNGNTYTSNGNVAIGSTLIAIDDTRGIVVGMPVTTLTGAIPAGTVIANVDPNSLITLSAATTLQINNNQALQIGYDAIRFTGWDHSNLEFVVASNTNIVNEIVTINQLGNFRANTVLANVVSTGNSTFSGNVSLGSNANVRITGGSNAQVLTTDGTGNLLWSAGYGNGNVANYLPTYTGNMTFANANLKVTGGSNGQILVTNGSGNLSWQTPASIYSNANVANYLPTYVGNMTFANANLKVTGGSNNQVLITDGLGNLRWQTAAAAGNAELPSNALAQFSVTLTGQPTTDVFTDEILTFTFSATYAASSATSTVARSSVNSRNWFSMAYDFSGTAVAVAAGTSVAVTTTDFGSTWTERALPASRTWTDVTWGNTGGSGTWVAVAASANRGAYSTDNGVTWTEMTMPATTNWSRVVYGNGRFVAIAGTYEGTASTTNIAATSTDGITWTQRTMPATTGWSGITYGTQFVAVAYNSNIAATSPDGVTWTQRTLSLSSNWFDIAWNGSVYAVSGVSTSILTSSDAINWTTRSASVANTHQIVASQGVFVAFPFSGSTAYISSDNGVSWSTLTGWTSGQYLAVAASLTEAGAVFLAVQRNGTATRMITRGTSYQVTLPAHGVYSQQQLFWPALVGGSPTPTQQAANLGAAIVSLRPTYVASYPSAGVVAIDTNSVGNITDSALLTLQGALSGTLTLAVTDGSGGRADALTIADPSESQLYTFSGSGSPQTRSQWAANLAAMESLTNYTAAVIDNAANTVITFTRTTPGVLAPANYLQFSYVPGTNTTLTANSSVLTGGVSFPDGGVLYNNDNNIAADATFTYSASNNTLVLNNLSAANTTLTAYNETVINGGSVSGAVVPNVAAGTIYAYTLTGNITMTALAGARAGTSATFILTQDTTGNRTLTATNWRFSGNNRLLTGTPNNTDILFVFYDGATYWASLNTGYQ